MTIRYRYCLELEHKHWKSSSRGNQGDGVSTFSSSKRSKNIECEKQETAGTSADIRSFDRNEHCLDSSDDMPTMNDYPAVMCSRVDEMKISKLKGEKKKGAGNLT